MMKQMRHKNVQTTMAIYSQVNNADLISSLPTRYMEEEAISNVVNLF
jgi:hypothetical protein